MKKTRLFLWLGATMSFAAFGFQQPDAPPGSSPNSSSSQTTTKKGKTSTMSDSAKTAAPGDSASDTGSRSRISDTSGSMLNPEDQKFMMDAAKGGMMEVQMGQAAQQKASSQAVKDFGKRMETDHGQVGKELEGIAKARNVSLPSDMGSEKSMMDKLSNRSGDAYDKAYMRMMISDHKKDIKEFEREVNMGVDSDLKAFATKNLPTLKEHLRMAEETSKSLGKRGSSMSGATTNTGAGDTATTPVTEKSRTKTGDTSKAPGTADNTATPAPADPAVPPAADSTKTPK